MNAPGIDRNMLAAVRTESVDGPASHNVSGRRLRHGLRVLGWPGILAMGLLAMCGAFYLSTLRPTELRLHAIRHSVLSLREQVRQAGDGLKRGERPAAEQLAEFYRMFPNEKELPDWLGKIFADAQTQGLVLEQGEYKATPEKVGRLMHYEITLPVKGQYPQIRKFLTTLADDVPIAGLEQIQFERQKVGTASIDSKIKLVLYLEKQT